MYLRISRSRDNILYLLASREYRVLHLIFLAYILNLIKTFINTLKRELDEDLIS